MLSLAQTLSYYKRKDVLKLILEHSQDKEIGVRYGDSFGKRPDAFNYENDILESAKKGATSFHCSEELWNNPLQLNAGLKRNDMDELRKGWDLIIDIDCPYWKLSKITAYLFIKALKDHGIESVTVKFSGGKGFHIGVPFEAFPQKRYYIDGTYKEVRELFPEGPRKIGMYLLHYINQSLIEIKDDKIHFAKAVMPIENFEGETGKNRKEFLRTVCADCKTPIDEKRISKQKIEYICPGCEYRMEGEDVEYQLCPKCKRIMEKHSARRALCTECGGMRSVTEFDLSSIVALDTILISSRHLYRMPYSLHEKTGLVSMPFDIKHILKFEKEEASAARFKPYKFLDRGGARPEEAEKLFQNAFEQQSDVKKKENEQLKKEFQRTRKDSIQHSIEAVQEAVPEEFFPPCIQKISRGLEDGKKRALFILINFLSSCNWSYEQMEEYIMKWNERNKPDQLRETYIRGQLRYVQTQKEKMPPPNCNNQGYMKDTGFCNPDGLCARIKNPAQYAKRKAYLTSQNVKKPRKASKNSEGKPASSPTS